VESVLNADLVSADKQYQLEFFPEEHCDECMETVHVHFKCPKCGDDYACTDVYGELHDSVSIGNSITCEECSAKFIFIEGTVYNGIWIYDLDNSDD